MKAIAKKKPLITRLNELGVCESGCEGRCQECPQDVANEAAVEIMRLRGALEAIGKGGHWLEIPRDTLAANP